MCAQAPAKSGKAAPRPETTDWPMYNRDLAGTRYSPLAQVNTRNVARLTKAWSFRLNARASEATPIVVNDVMYLPAGTRVVAVEPETGATRFVFDLGCVLHCRRFERDTDAELWMLYKPSGYVLSVHGNGTFSHQRGSEVEKHLQRIESSA